MRGRAFQGNFQPFCFCHIKGFFIDLPHEHFFTRTSFSLVLFPSAAKILHPWHPLWEPTKCTPPIKNYTISATDWGYFIFFIEFGDEESQTKPLKNLRFKDSYPSECTKSSSNLANHIKEIKLILTGKVKTTDITVSWQSVKERGFHFTCLLLISGN